MPSTGHWTIETSSGCTQNGAPINFSFSFSIFNKTLTNCSAELICLKYCLMQWRQKLFFLVQFVVGAELKRVMLFFIFNKQNSQRPSGKTRNVHQFARSVTFHTSLALSRSCPSFAAAKSNVFHHSLRRLPNDKVWLTLSIAVGDAVDGFQVTSPRFRFICLRALALTLAVVWTGCSAFSKAQAQI